MSIVIDASVAVKWFADESGSAIALGLLKDDRRRHAPDLVIAEVMNVLSRKIRIGEMQERQAAAIARTLPHFFDVLFPMAPIVENAFRLSRQLNHSIYDCAYLAVALQQPECRVVTADAKFADKASAAGYGQRMMMLEAADHRSGKGQEH